MTRLQLEEFARFGAQARLQAIQEERSAIVEAFPHLRRASGGSDGASALVTRRRRGMSSSQRKAVGERMKAYWAKRRGEKVGTEGAHTQTASDGAASPASHPSKRKGMSPAARKAHGERMKAYWAARKSAKNGAAVAGGSSTRRNARKTNRKK